MISIQTNVAALMGEVNYNTVQNEESNTIEQLTSGYRINSSADDAAGLAIANSLQAEQTELTQGVANANDGVSQLQIIDGGLTNMSTILDNLKTLATEAGSSTFTGDFTTLNNEFQSDLAELNRQASNIGLNTGGQFNENLTVYVGGGIGNQNGAQIGTAIENINLANVTATAASVASQASFTVTGVGATYASSTASGSFGVELSSSVSASGYTASFTAATAGTTVSLAGGTGYSATFSAATAATTAVIGTSTATGASTASASATGYTASFTAATAGTTVTLAGGTGYSATFSAATAATTAVIGTSANTGNLTESASSSSNYTVTGGSSASVAAVTATYFNSVDAYSLGLATGTAFSAATNIAITNVTQAQAAIVLVAQAVVNLGTVQGSVGAGINQLNFAIGLAQSQITNYASDQSQIRDADVATDASNLSKYQVLSQAGIAALAQANQMPQAVLKLLQ
jgi:flagellin